MSLEWLLERSWQPQEPNNKSWERLLAGLGPKKGPKWDPNVLCAPLFLRFQAGVHNWTTILWLAKCIFKLSNGIFKALQEEVRLQNWCTNLLQIKILSSSFLSALWSARLKRVGRRCQAAWPFGSAAPDRGAERVR